MSEVWESIPRAVAITWGMVADPQRGPKRELSHERIVEAAVGIADTEGLGAVTMSKVAAALGFTTMALYRYVTSKDDLLLLMQESVLTLAPSDPTLSDGKTTPAAPGWRQELQQFAGMLRGVYRDHPWLTEIPVSAAMLLTPNNLAAVDLALRAMRELRIPDIEKVEVLLVLTTFVRANSAMTRDLSRPDMDVPDSSVALLREVVTEAQYPFLYTLVADGSYLADVDQLPGDADDSDEDYRFGLQLILDGVAAYAERTGDQSVPIETEVEPEPNPLELDHVRRDPKVKEAVGRRKEAEGKLREARKREQEMIKRALDRGPK